MLAIWLAFGIAAFIWIMRDPKKHAELARIDLGMHYSAYCVSLSDLETAETDEAFAEAFSRFREAVRAICSCLEHEFGKAALHKFVQTRSPELSVPWPGEHAPDVRRLRDMVLSASYGRRIALEEIMKHPAAWHSAGM